MSERAFFDGLLAAWFVMAAVTFVSLCFVTAPYGRHARGGWGPEVPARAGWMIMELPAVVLPAVLFATGPRTAAPAAIAMLVLWEVHYVHRTFVHPVRMRMAGKTMPVSIPAMAFVTNLGIDYLNARWVFGLSPAYGAEWLTDPRFLAGTAVFAIGFVLNRHADHVLRNLRRPGETGYRIPRGGAYRWVSCPNYLGEIVQWSGWAVLTWSLPGLAFALWTAANLGPRAVAHHRWYRERFPDYPPERRALVPGVL